MGMVFQRFNLFPHMTVLENVIMAPMQVKAVAPRRRGWGREAVAKVGLRTRPMPSPASSPAASSSGDRPRAGDGAQVMLFDEPTSALDPNWWARC
jgi:polar amino acid transport system ATP-binding protein